MNSPCLILLKFDSEAFWPFPYIWFGFLCAQVLSWNCMSTESWKLCNLDPKAPKSCKNNDFNMQYAKCQPVLAGVGGGGACAALLSEPLRHYSLFCGQI